jgi:hypothetical protein
MGPYDTREMFDLIDLHTHSTHSDGTVAPAALVALAAARQVKVLALTDHDTTAGLAEAGSAAAAAGMRGDGFQVQAGQGETHGKFSGRESDAGKCNGPWPGIIEMPQPRAVVALCRRLPRARTQPRMMPMMSAAALGMLVPGP